MRDSVERYLAAELSDRFYFGQILIRTSGHGGFVLCHRDDEKRDDLKICLEPEHAIEIARYDDSGTYRPLKTAPNLRRGWRLEVVDLVQLRTALDYFYPGRLATFAAWKENRLVATPLRETLNRQSGMYRVAAKISDEQIDNVVGNYCRSNGGCLRTILWKRDKSGTSPSTKLPGEKFDPAVDQAKKPRSATAATAIPLLCQEACNLLVNECRKTVKSE
jgi:sirohydrochlorin cobaltochelatase